MLRHRLLAPGLIVSALLISAASPCAAATPSEVVVFLAPASASGRAAIERDFASRCAALGIRIERRLDDDFPPAAARLFRSGPPDPFELDPSRVVLVSVPDVAVALPALAADPAVAYAEPNVAREPMVAWIGRRPAEAPQPIALDASFPDDPLFRDGRQWGLHNGGETAPYGGVAGADVHALEAWATSVGSNDVRLGFADTGIDPGHPDLAATMPDGTPRIVDGFNVTPGPDRSVLDLYGHGTPVVGVFAARSNNGTTLDSLGLAGLCGGNGGTNLGCRIVPIKITHGVTGEASSFDVARAIFYATRAGCRAMNLSFAGTSPSSVERAALHYAMIHGCVVVAAAGNHGFIDGDTPMYPAAYAAEGLCVQVGASDESDQRPLFSSFGPGLDLVAPGVDIWTTFMTYPAASGGTHPGYVPAAGTSFAAPFVTGAIGLLAAARPELDAADFQPLLRASADDIGDPGPDVRTGWGRLDAAAALAMVAPGVGIHHDEIAALAPVAVGEDSVRVDGDAPVVALAFRGWHRATRWQVRATITIPDSFENAVVWPRVGGTSTVRGGSGPLVITPWAEAVALDARHVELRGALYHIEDQLSDPSEDEWLPVPPDQARIGYTILGRVKRAAGVHGPSGGSRLSASPNPFRGTTRITGPAGAPLVVLDVSGRTVTRATFDAAGRFAWDGRDAQGRTAPPGLYLLRSDAPGVQPARIVKVE